MSSGNVINAKSVEELKNHPRESFIANSASTFAALSVVSKTKTNEYILTLLATAT